MSGLALVTGAGGFVGRHLVDALLARGVAVRGIDLRFDAPLPDGVETVTASVLDAEAMRRAMAGVDVVHHLAAVSALWAPRTGLHHEVNVGGTRTVLDAALEAGVDRFVHCSSNVTLMEGGRFGGGPPVDVDENTRPPRHRLYGRYARSKRDAEDLVLAASGSMRTVIVHPGAPIGPGDRHPTPPGRLLRDAANGRVPAVTAGTINMIDVRALADAIAAAGEVERPAERYLLTGPDVSLGRLMQVIAGLTGGKAPRPIVPRAVALAAACVEEGLVARITRREPAATLAGVRMSVRQRRFVNALATRDLGLAPTDLEHAVAASLDWMAHRGMIEGRHGPGARFGS